MGVVVLPGLALHTGTEGKPRAMVLGLGAAEGSPPTLQWECSGHSIVRAGGTVRGPLG